MQAVCDMIFIKFVTLQSVKSLVIFKGNTCCSPDICNKEQYKEEWLFIIKFNDI